MDRIREGVKKPWAKFVIFAIVISFVGAGYFTSSLFLGDPFAAAVVNGKSISVQDFQRAYAQTRQQYGEAFAQFVKTPEQERDFKENVLQSLISREVTLQTAEELGLRISNSQLRKNIQSVDSLQVEGVYSADLLDQALVRIGKSRSQFKKDMVSDVVLAHLTTGITASEFVLPSESEDQYKILGQLRTGRALAVKYSLFEDTLEIEEDEINRYYQENLESFRLEEKISLDYIELSIEGLRKDITPSEEEIQIYYDDNLDRFRSEEQRRVSHILIAGDDDADNLSKAQAIKSQLDEGADFVALVKSNSSDEFSAENDGDLGILSAGDMEESFDLAMNTLAKVGDTTAPVKTSFGYHIIKLTELIEGTTQSLDEVKQEIIPALQKAAAEEQFFAKSKILEEKSFEFSDSLAEVSELIGIEIKTSAVFSSRKAPGIFANQEVKDAAFSDNVVNARMNSNLVNVSDGHVVVVRLNSHQASVIQELDVVKDQVVNRIKSAKSKDTALVYAETIKDKILANEDVTQILADKNLQWQDLDNIGRTATVLPYRQLQQFFKLATPSDGRVSTDIMNDSAELVVFILNKVEEGSLESAEKSLADQAQQRLSRFYSNASYASLVEQGRNQAEVSRNLDNINR